jgi:protein involved in polysaccharide export with SLBB domain
MDVRSWSAVVLCLVLIICLFGCGNKFWDPTQVGRFRPTPAVNVILDSLGVAEETPATWEVAEDPLPTDLVVFETDHVFGPGDIVRVFIFELLREGEMFVDDHTVTETGKISIPEVGVLLAAGYTEVQLEEEIRDILRPGKLKDPSVIVKLMQSQGRAFSILGNGIAAPNRYFVPRYPYRLADAIAAAGGIGEFNVSYIYVARPVTGAEGEFSPAEPGGGLPGEPGGLPRLPEEEMLEIVSPIAAGRRSDARLVVTSVEMMTGSERSEAGLTGALERFSSNSSRLGAREDRPVDLGSGSGNDRSVGPAAEGRIEWVFEDGRWVPVRIGVESPREPTSGRVLEEPTGRLEEEMPADFGWEEVGTAGVQTRVIKIPVENFQRGDRRYNIAIRPGDTIYVPADIIGEFYVMGNANRTGAIPLTGRPINLKMAIAAAGGLNPLAWAKRCEVTRRLGKNREETVMVDLDKIFSGEQPDFFIKVNDLINVGTHPTARWRAVLRNAFRATYGFGFVYDRNFADRDVFTRRPIPDIF